MIHSECLGMEGSLFDAAALRSECLGIDSSLFDVAALHSGFGEDISAQRLSTGQRYRSKVVASGVEVYRWWIQYSSATECSKNTSKGVLKSRHFLGRWFSLFMICTNSSSVTDDKSRFLGIYWRTSPFMFSLAPRS